ncbi:MAG: FKBP-type peptidyl-prolyl cis-trans isomerase [Bacteroidales bacterium]|nr:FKBP-type peptidyl-prolyl cis-trans isomerase [Bacteroidales bacterium]MCF8334700.1 FKBP-type peptidyl-prolyl cis-trans isomerase [Bacteroidales bacterium]
MLLRGAISIFFAMLLLAACNNRPQNPDQKKQQNDKKLEEALIDANKRAISEEKYMIRRYIQRHKWDMKKTGSGIYYSVYQEGQGTKARKGMRATLDYTIQLLNGYVCYSSQEKGKPKRFIIGKGGDVVSGLHKIMPHLQEGDKAKVIIPSYLAHGMAGDKKEIPSKATLVYDIHVLKLDRP